MKDPKKNLSTTPGLKEMLGAWTVSPTRDPRFRTAVWDRIRRQPGETWPAYVLARAPAVASVALAVVVAGAWSGHASARMRTEADRDGAVRAYVQAMDARWMVGP